MLCICFMKSVHFGVLKILCISHNMWGDHASCLFSCGKWFWWFSHNFQFLLQLTDMIILSRSHLHMVQRLQRETCGSVQGCRLSLHARQRQSRSQLQNYRKKSIIFPVYHVLVIHIRIRTLYKPVTISCILQQQSHIPMSEECKWLFFELRKYHNYDLINDFLHILAKWFFGSPFSSWQTN